MKVLVLTLSFGSGHVRAARALAEELARRESRAEVRVLDALEGCRLAFRACYVWPYWAMVRYAPALWEKFFNARVARMDEQTAPAWAFRRGCPQVFEEIERFAPDAIVAAEVAACEMAVNARRAGLTRARVVCVITDFEAEPVWVKPEVDAYAVADEGVREQLCAWGAPPEKVFVCGIPVAQDFRTRHDADATRARHRIEGDAPIVLLMGGGMGPTRMDEVATLLCESEVPMNLIAVTGHDARARRRLARVGPTHIGPTQRVGLHVLGWTDDVAALMQAASVLLTKPGGVTLAEAAECALPVVMFDRIPGPERLNAKRFADAGAGVTVRGPREAAAAAELLLRDERVCAAMSLRARELARPLAASDIARLALGEIGEGRTDSARARAASGLSRRMTA